jgi:hypothetical protein
MQRSEGRLALLVGGAVLACGALAANVHAQSDEDVSGPARPMYAVKIPETFTNVTSDTALPTWNGKFTFQTSTYSYNMVGSAPSTGASTTIQAYIIPIKITAKGGRVFDPAHVLSNGRTVIQNTVLSPIFDSTTTYIQGGVNVGTTQYIDAYQRANFWFAVSSHTGYHLLLAGPTVLTEQSLTGARDGTPFGSVVAEINLNTVDAKVQSIIKATPQLQPNTLPIFLLYDTYMTPCCIGGYHSSFAASGGQQAYAVFSYVDYVGEFAQDVSALSHEIGEWADDPLVVNTGNRTPCGILEVGDPLESNSNFGGFPYSVNGFTYNLQDLVTLPYFGAPPATSVNGFFTFHGEKLSVCQNGS